MDKYEKLLLDIKDFIVKKYNLQLDECTYIKRGHSYPFPQAYAFVDKIKGKLKFTIEIEEFDQNNYINDIIFDIKNLREYFSSFDITCDAKIALANFVVSILHELGHIKEYNKYKTKLRKYFQLNESIVNVNKMFFSVPSSLKMIQEQYIFNQIESHADIFAYQNFYLIWKHFNLFNF